MKELARTTLDDISLECNIPPAFVEKDWYLLHVLQVMQQAVGPGSGRLVFAGGTSLSKGFGRIRRFSEDIDFVIVGGLSRKGRSRLRDSLIGAVGAVRGFEIDAATIESRDNSSYATFAIRYPRQSSSASGLRNELKVEVVFKPLALPPVRRTIETFAGPFVHDAPVVQIDCVAPQETAANKVNALMWRVDIKNRADARNPKTNDPALIRHLYDLWALYPLLRDDPDFPRVVRQVFENDRIRGDKTRQVSLPEFFRATVERLRSDPVYAREYEEFVNTMLYAEAPRVSFSDALHRFESLSALIS